MRNVSSLETVHRDYAPKGVRFYYVYKSLAHPTWDGFTTPFSIEERLGHIAEAKRMMRTGFTWLADTMDNDLKHAMGDRPNSEFIVGPDGLIVRTRNWSDPIALRRDLAELVGEVTPATTIEDLEFVYQPPSAAAARDVVPRLERPDAMRMATLRMTPELSDNDEPYYAKLRPEGDRALIQGGDGKLYLGFFLDPLYGVHWNNADTAAIQVRLTAPDGVELSESVLAGPEVAVPADSDPREFMIDVKGFRGDAPIQVEVSYFACSDSEGFCKEIRQSYAVYAQRNRDNLWAFDRATNQAFNERIGRSTGEAIDTETASVDSRLPGAPPPEMVKRSNAASPKGKTPEGKPEGKTPEGKTPEKSGK